MSKILEGVQTHDERVMQFMRKPSDVSNDVGDSKVTRTTFTAVKGVDDEVFRTPRTPRRSSMALGKDRPDMSEIAVLADKQDGLVDDESESDAGGRSRLRTASALSREFDGVTNDEAALPPYDAITCQSSKRWPMMLLV